MSYGLWDMDELCVMDYELFITHNSFLITHTPKNNPSTANRQPSSVIR